MIQEGDWVRVTRLCKERHRVGRVVFVATQDVGNYIEHHVELFGEPEETHVYFGMEIQKINEMQVIAEAAR